LAAVGRDINFVKDNHSSSKKEVLRSLHCQTEKTQGKLVRVVKDSVYDVAVDLR
jgi:dTDP-4-dehydrorhamnose 3,5-epimerase